jgi:hypothetical protein
MATSLAEPTSSDISLWQLRENLIDVTVALADELVAGGDAARLEALSQLYETTRNALRQRDVRAAR